MPRNGCAPVNLTKRRSRGALVEAQKVQLPPSPTELRPELKAACVSVLEAEQWLETAGFRPCVIKLASPDTGEFLRAYAQFRDVIDQHAAVARLNGRLEAQDELERTHARSSTVRAVWAGFAGLLAGGALAAIVLL